MRNKRFKIILSIISILVFGYHTFSLFYLWSDIPSQIAIHFTGKTPDNWGSKYFLFVIPVISIFIWFLIGVLVKSPEKMNYVNLTEANKEIQFSRTGKVMLLIQNLSFISLILANEAMLRNAAGIESAFPFTISLLLLAICFIAPFYLLFWAFSLKY